MTVETRRFRTWKDDQGATTPAWRIIAKYGYVRMLKSWSTAVPLVLTAVFAILVIGTFSYQIGIDGRGVDYWDAQAGLVSFIFPAVAFVLLVGSGLLAEDLRYNAPLFYFSKPLSVRHYLHGKAGFLVSLIAATAFLPATVFLLMATVSGLGGRPIDHNDMPLVGLARSEWHYTHIDTVADWLYTWVVALTGMASVILFLCAFILFLSAHTRRHWHAAMAFVAVLGGLNVLGLAAWEVLPGAFRHILSPMGWMELVTGVAISARFDPRTQSAFGYFDSTAYDHVTAAVFMAHALLIGTAVAMWYATVARMRKMEAIL